MMNLEDTVKTLEALSTKGDFAASRALLQDMQAADVAEILDNIDIEHARRIVSALPARQQASVFGYLRPQVQAYLATGMSRGQLAALFELMDHDERADLYNRLSESERWAVLPGLAHAEREDIRQLASYPEGTVGSIMTSAYVTLDIRQTAREALERVRAEAPDMETIYQTYVLDAERHLLGVLSLRDLLLAPPETCVRELMVKDVIFSVADAPRAEAARLIGRYDLLALPVVNQAGQMVGIVTHDDALDVTQEKATEDQHRLGAVVRVPASLKEASVRRLYMGRVGWLVVLVFGNVFAGAGIAHFEDLISHIVALVFFLPLLIGSGGNAGSQSSTLMVRALATEDVDMRDWLRLLAKELSVSLLLGLSMAVAVSGIGFFRAGPGVAIVVSLTMVLIVIVGSLIGMSLPLLLTRFNMDPASASAPLVTSICDGVGVLIYFNVASLLLPVPGG